MKTTEEHGVTDRVFPPRPVFLYSGPARLLSMLSAGTLSLILSLYPAAVIQNGQPPDHSALMLCMWGIAAGFVHGVGFVPRNHILQIALGPIAAWLLMPIGTAWMLA